MKISLFALISFVLFVTTNAQNPLEKQYFSGFQKETPGKLLPMYNIRMDDYDVKFYKIDLQADNNSIQLAGNVTIKAEVVAESLDTFIIELNSDYTIDSVLFDDQRVSYTLVNDEVRIVTNPTLAQNAIFDICIYYHGALSQTSQGFFSGISNNIQRSITYTLSEPLYAKDWFPCKQVLTDKADSVYIFVTTNSNLKAGANGLLTATVPLGGGKVRYEWKSTYPIAYYLISMTIGDYVEYSFYARPEGFEDSIFIQNYVYDSVLLNSQQANIDQTAEIMSAFCNMFGMYPFKDEKYGHCMAPIGGGMEHQTMTTLSSFDFELVAHELAHMWFGDYVTCGTWQDIWINEGFATYSHLLALEYIRGFFPENDMFYYQQEQFAYAQTGSIYIPDADFDIDYTNRNQVANLSNRIFSWELSYQKGAIILHMLRYELQDDEIFFQILRDYLNEYQNSTAIGIDFKEFAESVSGQDLDYFFDQWYFGEGFPRYRITWNQENDTLFIQARQGKSTPEAPFFRMNMDYLISTASGDTTIRLEQTQATRVFAIPFAEEVQDINIDPDHWMLAEILSVTNGEFVGIQEEQIEESFKLYPNPFSDQLTIESSGEHIITIYNASGMPVKIYGGTENISVITTTDLPQGIYLIQLQEAGKTSIKKLVKN